MLKWCGRIAGVALMAACFGCNESSAGGDYSSYETAEAESSYSREERREEAVQQAASDLSGTTYADLGEPYGCTQDCSGHEAGVAWADENGITDPSDCGGRSQSFIEGCEAFAEEVQNTADQQF